MASFDDSLGGSTSNSYVSLNEANSFFEFNVYQSQWDAFSDQQKQAALVQACFFLETVDFAGTRCSPSTDDANLPQALSWPRSGASCDGVEATCAFIPKQVKDAQCLLALNLATSPDSITGPIGGGGGGAAAGTYVSKNQLGDLVQEFSEYSRDDSTNDCADCSTPEVIAKYPWLKGILACWANISAGDNSKILLRVRS